MIKSSEGYYQFAAKEDGLYVTVYPPKIGGLAAKVEDAVYYLDKKKIFDCDTVKLKKAFSDSASKKKECTEKISDSVPFASGEFGDYRMSSDCMTVEAVFYPPFEGAQELDEAEITGDLRSLGVKNGIDTEEINKFLSERIYGKAYIVAQGKKARDGKNGYIEYKFNPDLKPSPKMNDDGTVDYHSLENVNKVKEGDVVAVLHPEDQGEEGKDLLGRIVQPKRVKHVIFRNGRNLKISEDGLSLISQVSGHVMLEEDKVFVSNVLELGNIDNSTGDIEYDGSLDIKGNVLAGFSVKATGDISISGIVEGATVKSGGNITLNRGIQGMNKAVVKAAGNIVSKFIESAELVQAGGFIETDSILHSKVNAKGAVTASGKNGLIIGGDVRSMTLVEAKVIGNDMGTTTSVGVGIDPAAKRRIDQLEKSLTSNGKNKVQLNQIATALRKKQEIEGKLTPDKADMLQKTMRNLIMLEQEINKQKAEYQELREQLNEDVNAKIKVWDVVYNGAKLTFGDQNLFIKSRYDHCQFVKEGADIKSKPL